jgi:hypothetical protein
MKRAVHVVRSCTGSLAIAGLMLIAACQGRDTAGDRAGADHSKSATTQEIKMTKQDKKFFEVELDTNSPNDCTPELPDDDEYLGIMIAAPSRAPFKLGEPVGARGSFANVPICGAFVMDIPSPPTDEPMMFHVVNRATGDEYEGPIVMADEVTDIPPPEDTPVPAEDLEGMSVTGYFNHNLVDYVPLPVGPAVYDVTVLWRGKKSNTVTVELFEEK